MSLPTLTTLHPPVSRLHPQMSRPPPVKSSGGGRSRNHSSGEPKKKRKRGIKNEKLYKRNEVRMARLKGQPYVSYTGKLVEGKRIPTSVVCKCRSKCHSKLLQKNIQEIWDHFYSIENKNAQDFHLQNWIEVREIKRRKRKKRKTPEEWMREYEENKRLAALQQAQQIDQAERGKQADQIDRSGQSEVDRAQNDENDDNDDNDDHDDNDEEGSEDEIVAPVDLVESVEVNLVEPGQEEQANDTEAAASPRTFKKNYTFIYNVRVNGRITQICKNAFLQVFGVTESRIRRICDLLVKSKIPCDLRGKNRSVNTIETDVREKIHCHISQFEVREIFHEGKTKKYLDPGLNIVKMHDMFIKENPELQSKVKYSFYYQYFKEKFDYEFGQPQVPASRPQIQANHPPQIEANHSSAHSYDNMNVEMADSGVSDDNNENSSVAPELLALKKRAKDFYDALKSATDSKDYDSLALAFNYLQNVLVLPQQPAFGYNNYYYHHHPQHQDPNMLDWHHQNHQSHQNHQNHQSHQNHQNNQNH